MIGEVEVGAIAARTIFGEVAGNLFGLALALLLISTVSAMTMAGPRVIQVVGEDFPKLSFLGQRNASGYLQDQSFFNPQSLSFLLSPRRSSRCLCSLGSQWRSILLLAFWDYSYLGYDNPA